MKFNFNDFTVIAKQKNKIYSDEKIAIPTEIKNGKPHNYEIKHKTKTYSIFTSVIYKNDVFIDDIFDFIDLVEILKAFSSNKLNPDKKYKFNNFDAKLTKQKNVFYLHFEIKEEHKLYLDKFEATALAAKFSKILQKLDIFQ